MSDEDKTKEQLSHDLAEMRQRLDELESLESKRHWQEQQEAQKLRTAAQYIALIFAGLPLILGSVLCALNPQYMGRLIWPCPPQQELCSQPCGWLMVLLLAVLTLVSYVGLRGSVAWLKAYWWIAIVVVFLLATLPALLIILLGPAVLILMETNFG